jgi:hypothetical protein
VQPANVVEATVVGLTDERIHRSHVLVAGLLERPAHDALQHRPDAQGVGERDGGFDGPEFVHLGRTGQLAKGIPDIDGARHFFLEDVAVVGHDDGDPGPHVIADQ